MASDRTAGVASPGSDRIVRITMQVLAATLAGVYLFSAATGPSDVAVTEAVIGGAELAWVVLVATRRDRRWPLVLGTALQTGVTALWVCSRTFGLPGAGRLPVGEFDLLCAADALVLALLASPLRSLRALVSGRGRMALCEFAVALAACTMFMSMAGMMRMTTPAATATRAHGGAAPAHFFCELL